MTKEQTKTLGQKILDIMAELTYLRKGSKKVNNQYTFISHDQVSAAVHPMLVKHGVVIAPTVSKWTQEGNRTSVDLEIHVFNVDDMSDSFKLSFFGYGIDSGDKGPGKAISYAYKYAMLKLFCLETGDDPDNDANATYEPEKCREFDEAVHTSATTAEIEKIDKFLAYSSKLTGTHIEDLKRQALSKMPQFLEAAKKWKPKGEDK